MVKLYSCDICGKKLVSDEHTAPICCGQPMKEIVPNTTDGAHEKHVPVISREGNIVTVSVGSVLHPMLEAHYIEWIVLETNTGFQQIDLKPGDEPIAKFAMQPGEFVLAAYEYCNLHGFWKANA